MAEKAVPAQTAPKPTPANNSVNRPVQPRNVFAGKVVVLDAGHGGPDNGARGPMGTLEKDNTLAIVYKLKSLLEVEGATVVLTRTGDYLPGLDVVGQMGDLERLIRYRANLANQSKASILVSIHNDSNMDSGYNGTTTYYWGSPTLARTVQGNVVAALGSRNIGAIRSDFYILTMTRMPAILVEAGFISNTKEEQLLSSSWYQALVAKGVRNGLKQYFSYAG